MFGSVRLFVCLGLRDLLVHHPVFLCSPAFGVNHTFNFEVQGPPSPECSKCVLCVLVQPRQQQQLACQLQQKKTHESLSPKTSTITSPRTLSVISCCFDWLHVSCRYLLGVCVKGGGGGCSKKLWWLPPGFTDFYR